MSKSKIVAGLATAALLVVGGGTALAAAGAADPTPATGAPSTSPSSTSASPEQTPAAAPVAPEVPREQAERAALAKVAGGRVTSTELETEHGHQYWDVEVTAPDGAEHEFSVDTRTGALTAGEVDHDDDGPDGDDDRDGDEDDD
ncbi:PepSY domain-containing protein [Sphaerisporangium aureirubrum]|uniref:PepSY domain-containing protein n=1 Tax=Sphaerisporangium aureirubrum TaxID=1544736 RepID=A0ABW1NGN3_9ACTN